MHARAQHVSSDKHRVSTLTPSRSLQYATRMRDNPVLEPEIFDLRATIVLCLSSVVLSIKVFLGSDLSVLYASYPETLDQPWRLFTACMLHAGWVHLIFNIYWTFRFGAILEPVLGLFSTVVVFVMLGLTSSAAQWAFSGGGVGLSGIVYGLFGILWMLARYHPNFRGVIDLNTIRLFIGWFFLCIVLTELDVLPIANIAHGVGAVMGILFGLTLTPLGAKRWIAWTGMSVLTVVIGIAATVARPYVNFGQQRIWELHYDSYNALEGGDPKRAAELLERAIELDDEDVISWHNLGVAYARLGRNEEAARAFVRSERLERGESPGDVPRIRKRLRSD